MADHRSLSFHNHVSQYLTLNLFLHIYIDPTVSISLENLTNKHSNEAAVSQDSWEGQTCVVIFLICTSSYFCLCSHMIRDWSYLVILNPIMVNMCLMLAPCEICIQQQKSMSTYKRQARYQLSAIYQKLLFFPISCSHFPPYLIHTKKAE